MQSRRPLSISLSSNSVQAGMAGEAWSTPLDRGTKARFHLIPAVLELQALRADAP
jgi:hypothetical protein